MYLEPGTCVKCSAPTDKFEMIRLRFGQTKYERWGPYDGQVDYKGSKEIDHGEQPVFFCDDCVKRYHADRSGRVHRVGLVAWALVAQHRQ
jgi:hypothetical protein